MSLSPPTQEATYFCNKCGHFGRTGHTHSNCDYYAAKFGPYWDEAAVKLAVREALTQARTAALLDDWHTFDAIIKEYE